MRLADMPFRPNVCEDWRGHVSQATDKSIPPFGVLPDSRQAPLALSIMKNLIVAGNPVIVGISACREFQQPVNGYISRLDPSGVGCGGHAVLVVGYDDRINAVRILNSWGDGNTWQGSDDGKAWMSYPVFLQRYREGYVDQGPGQFASFGSSYTEFAKNQGAELASQPSPSVVLTPEILKASLRSNIGAKTGKTVIDADGRTHDVVRRYLWLDLPDQYANQVKSATYTLIDQTFPEPFTVARQGKKGSSVLLVWWKGWDCVDQAKVSVALTNSEANGGKPVEVDFNYCSVEKTQSPV